MHVFYSTGVNDRNAVLNAEESAHCARVLRLTAGEPVLLLDGSGKMYRAKLISANPKRCELEITEILPVNRSRNFDIEIAIAPTKSMDRFEWFVEKAVEIGVDTITPLLCRRSERKVINNERLQKLVISTMKQAMVAKMPVIRDMTKFDKFISGYDGPLQNRFIAHCLNEDKKLLQKTILPSTRAVILIGPEGDFTPEEIQSSLNHHFIPVSLGDNRLRTETAGIVACTVLNS
jgi:16S rRNA (uracil1498-N3)-methyltransferase